MGLRRELLACTLVCAGMLCCGADRPSPRPSALAPTVVRAAADTTVPAGPGTRTPAASAGGIATGGVTGANQDLVHNAADKGPHPQGMGKGDNPVVTLPKTTGGDTGGNAPQDRGQDKGGGPAPTEEDRLARWSNISTIIASVLAVIAGAAIPIAYYRNRPSFNVGILPSSEDMRPEANKRTVRKEDIGKLSFSDEFRHNSKCLAAATTWWRAPSRHYDIVNKPRDNDEGQRRLRIVSVEPSRKQYEDKMRIYNDHLRTRHVEVQNGELAELAIILENYGRRVARDYVLRVQFMDDRVRIYNIVTESQRVTGLYLMKPDSLSMGAWRLTPVAKSIVDRYDSYLKANPACGDIVCLGGTMPSQTYEMVIVTVSIEWRGPVDREDASAADGWKETMKVPVTFALDCSDNWMKRQVFVQGVEFVRRGGRAQSGRGGGGPESSQPREASAQPARPQGIG